MPAPRTANVKYLYLDIVGFTKSRSVEAQFDLIVTLNRIVAAAIKKYRVNPLKRFIRDAYSIDGLSIDAELIVLLPTGDGMCIALVNFPEEYDAHIQVALHIVRLIDEHNLQASDKQHQFEVRIGINEGDDFLIRDINNRKNVAGSGINMAQRITSAADGGNVLVSDIVYGKLSSRAQYEEHFSNSFVITIKHGATLTVFQYLNKDIPGLNNNVPSVSRTPRSMELSEKPFKRGLVIHSASYGEDDKIIDVAEYLQRRAATASTKNKLQMKVSNAELGIEPGKDPSPGVEKDLTVVYSIGGKRIIKKVHEYDTLELP